MTVGFEDSIAPNVIVKVNPTPLLESGQEIWAILASQNAPELIEASSPEHCARVVERLLRSQFSTTRGPNVNSRHRCLFKLAAESPSDHLSGHIVFGLSVHQVQNTTQLQFISLLQNLIEIDPSTGGDTSAVSAPPKTYFRPERDAELIEALREALETNLKPQAGHVVPLSESFVLISAAELQDSDDSDRDEDQSLYLSSYSHWPDASSRAPSPATSGIFLGRQDPSCPTGTFLDTEDTAIQRSSDTPEHSAEQNKINAERELRIVLTAIFIACRWQRLLEEQTRHMEHCGSGFSTVNPDSLSTSRDEHVDHPPDDIPFLLTAQAGSTVNIHYGHQFTIYGGINRSNVGGSNNHHFDS
ncbi:hypothetical protein HGRIS_005460 [Hohenbuehelia grisea]|uniref:Uncharacterized protein n=1 Tax=Hohenbuehelia grisea TaxID=104357 RepID=A0ABR3JX27_9AGAR